VGRFQRGRQRRRLQKAERLLRTIPEQEHASAAMLAIATERIARIESRWLPPIAVVTTREIVENIRDDYEDYVARVVTLRDVACAEAVFWRARSATASRASEPVLAAAAAQRAREWERRHGEATATLELCAQTRNRIADAVAELDHLAHRLAAAQATRS
jgi:hypothetical protein